MFLLSILISIFYTVLIKYCLKFVIYALIISLFCIMFAILVIAIGNNNYGLIITMALGMLFFAVFLICMRNEIKLGMELMNIATRFMGENLTVYLAPVWVFFLAVLFFVFWVVSVVAVQSRANMHISQGVSTGSDLGIMGYFLFMYIFMSIFFYYVLTFLISTNCALWYYNIEDNYWCLGMGRINRYHIGSFTFGALLLALVKIMQLIINSSGSRSENACARCVQCFISCLLSQVEYLLRVLNNTTVIVMSVTGESYCDAAKTSAFVLFDHLGLFATVSVISNLVMFGGIVLAVGLPTIVGLLYCSKRLNPTDL
jgi:choline transporter-like protein 2/4/5